MRHVLSAVVQNVPGVLAHISGMLASRGYNIDSLAVGRDRRPELVADDVCRRRRRPRAGTGAQAAGEDRHGGARSSTSVRRTIVERDLMLLKVKAPPGGKRSEIRELVEIFRGKIVDVGAEEMMIEISGRENKIEAFIERMRGYGITELVRTGRIAMVRSGAYADD